MKYNKINKKQGAPAQDCTLKQKEKKNTPKLYEVHKMGELFFLFLLLLYCCYFIKMLIFFFFLKDNKVGKSKTRIQNAQSKQPFICPIKDCIVQFTAQHSVKRHFIRFHSHLGDWEDITKKTTFHVSTFNDSGQIEQQEQAHFSSPMIRNYIQSKNQEDSQDDVTKFCQYNGDGENHQKSQLDSTNVKPISKLKDSKNNDNLKYDENSKDLQENLSSPTQPQPPLLPHISHLLDSIPQPNNNQAHLLFCNNSKNLPSPTTKFCNYLE